MSNSPTVTVGYPVVGGKLEKTAHKIPLLSLDKVKSSVDLCRFMGEHQVMIMLKLDGLTIKLTYENGDWWKRPHGAMVMRVRSSLTTPEQSVGFQPIFSTRASGSHR